MNEKFLTLLEDKGLISIAGIDAQNYLQGLLTIDVREIGCTQYHLGGCCNNKGRLVASFNLFEYKNTYYFSLPRLNIPTTLGHLRKYAMFSKVEIKEATNDFVIIGAFGENALEKLQGKLPEKAYECAQRDFMTILRLPGNQVRFEVILERVHEAEFLLLLDLEEIQGTLKNSDKNFLWKKCDILSGIPAVYPETAGLFTPQMLNYDDFKGISFNKGCYLGQEIVARTASLGVVKKHLYVFTFDSSQFPAVGDVLENAQSDEIGVVLEACHDDSMVYLSAVVQDAAVSEKIYWRENPLVKVDLYSS